MKAILFKEGIEVKRAPYPRADMALLEGQKSYIEWKLIVENAIPTYDRRTHNLVITEDNTNDPHPTYTHLKQYTITYSTVKKSNAQIVDEVILAEEEANKTILSNKNRFKYLAIGLAILERKAEGQNITPKMQNILDIITTKATNMWLNDTEADTKKATANADGVPDLDAGWNTSEI